MERKLGAANWQLEVNRGEQNRKAAFGSLKKAGERHRKEAENICEGRPFFWISAGARISHGEAAVN